jgi:hypothetical protein
VWQDIGLKALPTESSSTAVSVDPILAMEKAGDQKRIAEKESAILNRLIALKRSREEDNYGANAVLRRGFREEKRARKDVEEESRKKGVGYDLLPPSEEDAEAARGQAFAREGFRKHAKAKMARIMGSSIFGDSYGGGMAAPPPPPSSSSSSSSRALIAVGGKKKGGGVASVLGSKHAMQAKAKQMLSVTRATRGIDPKNFVVNGSAGSVGASKLSLLMKPPVVKRKS